MKIKIIFIISLVIVAAMFVPIISVATSDYFLLANAEKKFRNGEYLDSIEIYKKIDDTSIYYIDAQWGIGKSYHRSNSYEQAIQHYDIALSSDMDNGKKSAMLGDKGNALLRIPNNGIEGKRILEEATKYDSFNVDALNGLGNYYAENIKDYHAAIQQYQKTLDIDQTNVEALIGIANSYDGLHNTAKSQEYYITALKLDSCSTNAWRGLMNTLDDNDRESAILITEFTRRLNGEYDCP